jgi:hypothetical protein
VTSNSIVDAVYRVQRRRVYAHWAANYDSRGISFALTVSENPVLDVVSAVHRAVTSQTFSFIAAQESHQ